MVNQSGKRMKKELILLMGNFGYNQDLVKGITG